MITIVVGKPGSGKSYDAVRNLLKVLESDISKGSIRPIYTNLSLNIEEINKYLSLRFSTTVDIRDRVSILDRDFFEFDETLVVESDLIAAGSGFTRKKRLSDDCLGYWWNRFDEGAYIIIDEIQQYLNVVSNETTSTLQSICKYFSTHRHRRHDIILITQALTNISVDVRRYAEIVLEIFNAKSVSIPFPFNISGRDLDILRAGFGIINQVYRVRHGVLSVARPNVIDFSGEVEVIKTSPSIYACYHTHTMSEDTSATDYDLPFKQDKFVKLRAIYWFLKKYYLNFGLKIFAVVAIVIAGRQFFFDFLPRLPEYIIPSFSKIASLNGSSDEKLDKKSDETSTDDESSLSDSVPVPDIKVNDLPLPSGLYSSAGVVLDGVFVPVGSIYEKNKKRLVSVDVRRCSCVWEDPNLFYLSSFAFVANSIDWLQDVSGRKNEF